ncbi:MAG TPA: DUF1569 domain-containing protein [Bacteroidia bacterium]|jgi:hypothetical protein|nr:DUF1569 domain-containing protein [Bacteroidia bacterium]
MRNLFESEARTEVLSRLEKINTQSQRQWGEMSVDQMLWHLNRFMSYAFGEFTVPFRGNWFLKTFVKPLALGKTPFPKGRSQTPAEFKATGKYDIENEKKRFIEYIEKYSKSPDKKDWPLSPLLGKFTGENWARIQYKHIDHHFRQFGE